MIPSDFIQTLLSRVDVVAVVDQYVPLKKGGTNFVACCPFHSEKTPSFPVSPPKQFYHCFGCAPDDWETLAGAFPDYQSKVLESAGLVIAGDAGKRYDRFRDRIMFPIHDGSGRVIGFGGRVLDRGEPKYLNSPETPLFSKGRELYGLFQARPAVRAAGKVVVVEGYMDVVALAQLGVEFAVATLGTATTPTHAQKLFRVTDTVIFCFDGDEAGRRAAWRALENTLSVLADGKDARFLFLPDGEDPDDTIRQRGRSAFEARMDQARPLSYFLLNELAARHPPRSA